MKLRQVRLAQQRAVRGGQPDDVVVGTGQVEQRVAVAVDLADNLVDVPRRVDVLPVGELLEQRRAAGQPAPADDPGLLLDRDLAVRIVAAAAPAAILASFPVIRDQTLYRLSEMF